MVAHHMTRSAMDVKSGVIDCLKQRLMSRNLELRGSYSYYVQTSSIGSTNPRPIRIHIHIHTRPGVTSSNPQPWSHQPHHSHLRVTNLVAQLPHHHYHHHHDRRVTFTSHKRCISRSLSPFRSDLPFPPSYLHPRHRTSLDTTTHDIPIPIPTATSGHTKTCPPSSTRSSSPRRRPPPPATTTTATPPSPPPRPAQHYKTQGSKKKKKSSTASARRRWIRNPYLRRRAASRLGDGFFASCCGWWRCCCFSGWAPVCFAC